jgi:hypothetical protein
MPCPRSAAEPAVAVRAPHANLRSLAHAPSTPQKGQRRGNVIECKTSSTYLSAQRRSPRARRRDASAVGRPRLAGAGGMRLQWAALGLPAPGMRLQWVRARFAGARGMRLQWVRPRLPGAGEIPWQSIALGLPPPTAFARGPHRRARRRKGKQHDNSSRCKTSSTYLFPGRWSPRATRRDAPAVGALARCRRRRCSRATPPLRAPRERVSSTISPVDVKLHRLTFCTRPRIALCKPSGGALRAKGKRHDNDTRCKM